MPTLASSLRSRLERVVIEARDVAEVGSRAALEALAVHHYEPYPHMSPADRQLRNRLRAKARSLGDVQDRTGSLTMRRIVVECAYEQWHRMLFARFLAENGLLILPSRGVSISLAEAEELASRDGLGVWEFVSRCAQSMLPQIFRPEDPLLQVELAAEHQVHLRNLIDSLPSAVFTASDSLGWVYQYWQSKRKDEVNCSGDKLGADEIPAVTQLFTEPYMVQFLLHNTLGAWWAGKHLSQEDLAEAPSEEDLRSKVALPGVTWDYLRFVRDDTKGESPAPWRIAAGTLDEWPKLAREIKVLDPCCGSGHFLVAALYIMVPIRMAEEGLTAREAVDAVLRDNLHGLEIDNRCCQIAAFALALTAWSYPGSGEYRPLPELHVACSGIGPQYPVARWIGMLDKSDLSLSHRYREAISSGLVNLHESFSQARTLGSLINPLRLVRDLYTADYRELEPLLDTVLRAESVTGASEEEAVVATGMVEAAKILSSRFTLVATNVPYLGRAKQSMPLKAYLEEQYAPGKPDLATAFLLRCQELCLHDGVSAIVIPQNWLFLKTYLALRKKLLLEAKWDVLVRLGAGAFSAIGGHVVNVVLAVLTKAAPKASDHIAGLDVSAVQGPSKKAHALMDHPVSVVSQAAQHSNPDKRVTFAELPQGERLADCAVVSEGLHTGDYQRFGRVHWELPSLGDDWEPQQGGTEDDGDGGCSNVLYWQNGSGELMEYVKKRLGDQSVSMWIKGDAVWGKIGIAVGTMNELKYSRYLGVLFTHGIVAIVPNNAEYLPALVCYAESGQLRRDVRALDQKVCVSRAAFEGIPFDLSYWQGIAKEHYLYGLPKPQSNDPTQWLFHGHPAGMVAAGRASKSPYLIADPVGTERHPSLICRVPNTKDILQVAVARLLGYRWPAEIDAAMELDEASRAWVEKCADLDQYADRDGIVCLSSVLGEAPANERLIALLHASGLPLDRLMEWTGGASLEDWLRNTFFAEHCRLFHHRPFIWHIWDGRRRDGFHALVNYHKLCAAGGGRQLLEKITYSYLGDWLARQKDAVNRGEGGADDRLVAATVLQNTLKDILAGEPPYDIFVRWKPLSRQPIGWAPDPNDGVRVNIRPFMAHDLPNGVTGAGVLRVKPNIRWGKDRGKEPARSKDEYPWLWGWDQTSVDFAGGSAPDGNRWNACHYTVRFKQAARRS